MERIYQPPSLRIIRNKKSAATGTCGAPKKAASLAAQVALTAVACIVGFLLLHRFLCYSMDLEWKRMQIERQHWLEMQQNLR